jgi:hypothetical protein
VADEVVATMQPTGVTEEQPVALAESECLRVRGDRCSQQWDRPGRFGGAPGQVVEPEPYERPAWPGWFQRGAKVSACCPEEGGLWCGQGAQGGGVLVGECPGDLGAVHDSGASALVGGLLAGEKQEAGRVGLCRSIGVRDELGVGKARITGTLVPRFGNYRYDFRVGVSVRADCHQLTC